MNLAWIKIFYMSPLIKSVRTILLVFMITFLLIITIDFIFGKKIVVFIKSYNINKNLSITRDKLAIKNDQFSYNFKENLNQEAYYIDLYRICTNKISLRVSCKDQNKDNLDYDILFIGDSATEGIGLPYEETFVSQFEKKVNVRVGNLGISSYSPHSYYNKIKAYSKKIDYNNLNEVIVFVDLSDVRDDLVRNQKIVNINDIKNEKIIKKKGIQNSEENKFNLKDLKFFLKKNIPISYELASTLKNWRLTSPKYMYIKSYPKSAWTYNENFEGYDVRKGVDLNIYHMTKLYNFLNSYDVKLSLAIYPWPNTLLYDQSSSRQVEIWKNFCINKCNNFINFFPTFFENNEKLEFNNAKRLIKKYFIRGDMHYNALGNKKIANKLIELYK